MEGKSSSKNKARLVVLIVFVIGFAAGALSLNLYQRLTSAKEDASKTKTLEPELSGNEYIIKKMNDKLSLSDKQQGDIKAILDERNSKFRVVREEMEPKLKEFEPRFTAIRQESREKIRALLTEEQRPKYDEMLAEQDRKREQMREQHKGRK